MAESVELTNKAVMDVKALIDKNKTPIQQVISKNFSVEEFARIVLLCCRTNPTLLACSRTSLFGAMLQCAAYGLRPGLPGLNEAWLIPRDLKKGGLTANFQIGYMGIDKLVLNTRMVKMIERRVVHEGDDFSYCYGLNPDIQHVPRDTKDDLPITHAYCIHTMADGSKKFIVMPWHEIDKVRKSSQSFQKGEGPWIKWLEAMVGKTVSIKMGKGIPWALSAEKEHYQLARAIALDGQGDADERQVFDPEIEEVIAESFDLSKKVPASYSKETEGAPGTDSRSDEAAAELQNKAAAVKNGKNGQPAPPPAEAKEEKPAETTPPPAEPPASNEPPHPAGASAEPEKSKAKAKPTPKSKPAPEKEKPATSAPATSANYSVLRYLRKRKDFNGRDELLTRTQQALSEQNITGAAFESLMAELRGLPDLKEVMSAGSPY